MVKPLGEAANQFLPILQDLKTDGHILGGAIGLEILENRKVVWARRINPTADTALTLEYGLKGAVDKLPAGTDFIGRVKALHLVVKAGPTIRIGSE